MILRKKLNKKSFLYLLLYIFPVLVGSYLTYNAYEKVETKIVEQISKRQEVYAKQAAKGITNFFSDLKASLSYFATDEDIISMNIQGRLKFKNFLISNEDRIYALSRVDKNGILKYTSPENKAVLGKDLKSQPHNRKIIENQKPIVSEVFMAVQGYRAIAYSYPIFRKGEYDGCVTALIPFHLIAKKYIDDIVIEDFQYAMVLSELGIEVYCKFEDHLGKPIRETSFDSPHIVKLTELMLSGKSGKISFNVQNIENTTLQAGMRRVVYEPALIENTFWSIAVIIKDSDILAITSDFTINLYLIILFSLTFFVIIIIVHFNTSKKSAQKLEKSEEKYRMVTEQTGQIIYDYDIKENKIERSGAIEEVIGYSTEEFSTLGFEEWKALVHEEDRDNAVSLLEKSISKGQNYSSEYKFKHKNGSYIFIEDKGASIKNDLGEVIKILGTMSNITDKKEAELKLKNHKEELEKLVEQRTAELTKTNEQLEEDIKRREATEAELIIAKENAEKSEKLKTEFLAQMSHEIRTPINTILNYVSLIKMESEDKISDDVKTSYNSIDNAALRLTRTIDMILSMSEIEAQTYEVSKKEVNLIKIVIGPLISEFKSIAENKNLGLVFENEADIDPILFIDYYTVSQIFANLIDNAIKYTESGTVKVILSKKESNIFVEIKDTGIGISQEFIPDLFNKFSQEEQGYTRRFEGNGLGLALVQKYCELNNAQIEVESKKGEGSTFRVIFN